MSNKEECHMKAVVDRIEGDTAVLLFGDEEIELHMTIAQLPHGTRESAILKLNFELDMEQTQQKLDSIRARIERLKRKRPR